MPDNFEYIIENPPQTKTHEEYKTITSPVKHVLCKDIIYEATTDLKGTSTTELLTKNSSPLSYDSEKQKLNFFSRDLDLIGEYKIYINAHIPITNEI